jgi:hypothetical protein
MHQRVRIIGNTVEHNEETGIKLYMQASLFRRPGHNTITESEEGIIMLTGYSNNNLLAGKTPSRILNRNTDGSDQPATSQMCSKTTA